MRDDRFTVIPQNMREYEISVRDATPDNDDFREAFEAALSEDTISEPMDVLLAFDFFKAGWEAAVRLLNDDAPDPIAAGCGFAAGDWVKVIKEEPFHWAQLGTLHQVQSVRPEYGDVLVWGGNMIDWHQIEITPSPAQATALASSTGEG